MQVVLPDLEAHVSIQSDRQMNDEEYFDFCERNPGECPSPHGAASRIAFTDQNWAMLQDVNISINNSIRNGLTTRACKSAWSRSRR